MRNSQILICLSFSVLCCDFAVAQAFSKAGPEHQWLKETEGAWDVVMTFPGDVKATGEMTCTMECNDMWLVSDLKISIGRISLQTRSFDGYDPVKQKYVGVQVDSMSTFPMTLEGTYDEATATLTQTGEARDFDGSTEQVKSVTRRTDKDHTTVEAYRVHPDGKETKQLTIEYTRRADEQPTAP